MRLKEACEVESVRYYKQCKCDRCNESLKVTTKANHFIHHTTVAAKADKELVQNQR